jgi:hypothetical protein
MSERNAGLRADVRRVRDAIASAETLATLRAEVAALAEAAEILATNAETLERAWALADALAPTEREAWAVRYTGSRIVLGAGPFDTERDARQWIDGTPHAGTGLYEPTRIVVAPAPPEKEVDRG